MKPLTFSKFFLALMCLTPLLAGSCSTPRQMTYLQDMAYNTAYDAPPAPEITLQPEDRLDIQVLSENPLLAAPFNAVLNAQTPPDTKYVIDSDGDIEFPVLGRIHVAGETVNAVKDIISKRIVQSGFIKEPVVRVRLDNFSITVVGSAGNKVLTVNTPSINLFQALAQTGGMLDNAKIKDVMVVRTQQGQRTAYTVNLKSRSVYDSPAFYLRQNDMVYIKPRGSRLSSEGQTIMTFVGTGLSLASIVTNFLIWTRYR